MSKDWNAYRKDLENKSLSELEKMLSDVCKHGAFLRKITVEDDGHSALFELEMKADILYHKIERLKNTGITAGDE